MIRRYVTSYVFLLSLFLVGNFIVLSTPMQLRLHDNGGFFLLNDFCEEGFCAGTLVKTPFGYSPIEDCC